MTVRDKHRHRVDGRGTRLPPEVNTAAVDAWRGALGEGWRPWATVVDGRLEFVWTTTGPPT